MILGWTRSRYGALVSHVRGTVLRSACASGVMLLGLLRRMCWSLVCVRSVVLDVMVHLLRPEILICGGCRICVVSVLVKLLVMLWIMGVRVFVSMTIFGLMRVVVNVSRGATWLKNACVVPMVDGLFLMVVCSVLLSGLELAIAMVGRGLILVRGLT